MQTMYFLDLMQASDPETCAVSKSVEKLKEMDALYRFTESGNAEIRFRWQILCIGANMEEIIPHVIKLLTEQGRMKFTRPLYRALFEANMGTEIAKTTFLKNRSMYHAICAKMVARDLGLDDK